MSATSQTTLQFAQRVDDGLSGMWGSDIDESEEVHDITQSVERLEVQDRELGGIYHIK